MRIDYINNEIMEALLQGYPTARYATITASADEKEELYIIGTNGFVAYVLERNEIYFDLTRCRREPDAFKPLLADEDLLRIDNMLETTLDVRVAGPGKITVADYLAGAPNYRLLTRFKGATWDTFIDMALLEAFDAAKYYQAKKNGPIAVVEDGALVGYVMPCTDKGAEGHYTDSPSYENPLIEDEEE